jgi:hypothetical protein
MFLTTFQGILGSFTTFPALNKEKIAALQSLLEAQERRRKIEESSVRKGTTRPESGAKPSDRRERRMKARSMAQSPQWARMAQKTRRMVPARDLNPINSNLIQEKGNKVLRREIYFSEAIQRCSSKVPSVETHHNLP